MQTFIVIITAVIINSITIIITITTVYFIYFLNTKKFYII